MSENNVDCIMRRTGKEAGLYVYTCVVCGRTHKSIYPTSQSIHMRCKRGSDLPKLPQPFPIPETGAGTELARITAKMSLKEKEGCNCNSVRQVMDMNGTEWCKLNRKFLISQLQANAKLYSWMETIRAASKSPSLTLRGLLDRAIRQAEAKGHTRPPVRVAFLAPTTLLGGAERWFSSLIQHFDTAKVWPQYLVLTEPHLRSPVVEEWIKGRAVIVTHDLLPQVMQRIQVLISWGVSDLAQRTKGAPCKIIEVQHGTMGFGGAQAALAKAGIDAGAHLAAVSEACLDNFPEQYRSQVRVIQNGAETNRLKPILGREKTRAELGIKPGQKMCLFIGRITAVKNLNGLARAMRLLPDWKLVIAGPYYQKTHCLGDAIVLPAQEQLGDLLAAADVFCYPSFHEANALAGLEAMWAGVPTVTAAYPAALELQQRHGQMSTLVPVDPDAGVLADAIVRASKLRGTPQIKKIQQVVAKYYTADVMAENWQNYIQEIVYASR